MADTGVKAPALDPLPSGVASLPQGFLAGLEGAVRGPGAVEVCREHGEELSLFCLDDLQPVCRDCGGSDSHAGHRLYPVTEAVNDCQGEMAMSLSKLQDAAIKLGTSKHTYQHASTHNQLQAQQTEEQMKQDFERLHQFLREEEEARLSMLREEEEERRGEVEDKKDAMTTAMEALEEKIREIEREMEEAGDGLNFLQNYKETVKRTWESHDDAEKVCGPLIDVSKHLGNLRFSVWNKMMNIAPYTPVTLDPTTANPALCLHPGLSCVRVYPDEDQRPSLPATPERFHPYYAVLGQEAISSGLHYWDVEVGDSTNWTLGVASQSLHRREEFEACPEAGLWCLSLRDGIYCAMATPCQVLYLQEPGPLRRVRVKVSWEQGYIVFTDPHTDTHLYTFHHRFTEALRPYFESVCSRGGLQLLPRAVAVETRLDRIPEGNVDHQEIHASSDEEVGSVDGKIPETIPTGSPVKKPQAAQSTDDPVEGKKGSANKSSGTNQNPEPKSKSTGKTKQNGSVNKKTAKYTDGYHISLIRSQQLTRSPSNSLATPDVAATSGVDD